MRYYSDYVCDCRVIEQLYPSTRDVQRINHPWSGGYLITHSILLDWDELITCGMTQPCKIVSIAGLPFVTNDRYMFDPRLTAECCERGDL